MRTVLVTGGAGFIGSHLVEALVQRGERVRVLDNLVSGDRRNLAAVEDRIEFLAGDLADARTVARAVEGVDCVFHQAALASVQLSLERPLESHAACATGTLQLLDAARRAGVRRVVYAGSASAYGDDPALAKRETDLPRPISPYAAAKLAGEYYCHAFTAAFGLETVCLRYFNVFGPRQDPRSPYSGVIALFTHALVAGRRPTIYGDGLQSRDFVYVDNVVQANLLAADAEKVSGRTFNIGTGRSITLLELLRVLGELLDSRIEPQFAPPRPGDIRESLADIHQARDYLGYEPTVSFEEGLRRCVDYYRHALASSGR
jgi:UDP-glucose 4-epimerase